MHTIIWELMESTDRRSYANLFSHFFNQVVLNDQTIAKILIQFLIFAQFCSLFSYTGVSNLISSGWYFLAHLLNVFGITDLPYSNKDTQEIDQSDPTVIKYRYICMGILALLILPVNCVKELATIRYVSMIIMIVVLYTISVASSHQVTIFQTPEFIDHNKDKPSYSIDVWANDFDLKWFSGWATMMFSYNCQITLFYVRGEMMHKTQQRIRKVSRIFIGVLVVFYLTICYSGYFSLGKNDIPKLITLRKPVGTRV